MACRSVIIIGGGLGGLFCGAILSKEGMDVTVLEKNSTAGGGLQSFSRFGVCFDTGMHIIGGMQKDGNIRKICEYLGIQNELQVRDVSHEEIDRIYFSEDRKYYTIAQGKERYVEALSADFPLQRDNLRRYVDAMYSVVDEVDMYHLRPATDTIRVHSEDFLMPATEFIAKYISDERLRSIVAYMNPLYGGRKNVTPAYIHAVISVLYIEGPSRFAGGSWLFADSLQRFICGHGGRVLTGDGVEHVCTQGRHITSVTTRSGKRYSADCYVCDVHPCTFISLLDDPSALPKSYRDRLDSIPNAYSAFSLNIKLKPGSFRYFNHSAYYMKHYADMWSFDREDIPWPLGFICMTPPDLDQGEYASKLSITAPMLWSACSRWENTMVGKRGREYEDWKEEMTGRLLDCMEEMFPGFRLCVENVNAASPLTIRDYYGVKEGSMCGFSKDSGNMILSQVPVVTKIDNLFLTGQNCNLHGFCGVALTSINTCEAILGRNVILDRLNGLEYEDIRPYYDSEIPQAMKRIASSPYLPSVARYAFPGRDIGELRTDVLACRNIHDFQINIVCKGVEQVMKDSMSEFSYGGYGNIDTGIPHLFVSNHRDIVLDAALLQNVLLWNGLDTTEITFGANLMQDDFVVDVGKSNKMFRVERPGHNAAQFYKSSAHLSDYMRHTILESRHSIWIANRNGRTKDGIDRTDQGIIKMFALSVPENKVEALSSLNIVPIAVSYEWEPCDFLKAVELYAREKGPYTKKEGEDINSIVTGLLQQKGRVRMEICTPLSREDIRNCVGQSANQLYRNVAALLDKRINGAYHLFPNNYIAHDLLSGTGQYSAEYTAEGKDRFLERLSRLDAYVQGADMDRIREIFLGIYANPVDSKNRSKLNNAIL